MPENVNQIISNILLDPDLNSEKQKIVDAPDLKNKLIYLKKLLEGQYFNQGFYVKYKMGEYGNLAKIPWIIITLPHITKHANKGHYLALLFIKKEDKTCMIIDYTISSTELAGTDDIEREVLLNYFSDSTKKTLNNLLKKETYKDLKEKIFFNKENYFSRDQNNDWGFNKTGSDYRNDAIAFSQIDEKTIGSVNIFKYLNLFLSLYKEVDQKNIYKKTKNKNINVTLTDLKNSKSKVTDKIIKKNNEVEKERNKFRVNLDKEFKKIKINDKEYTENFLSGDISMFPRSEKAHIIPVAFCVNKWRDAKTQEESLIWFSYISNADNGLLLDPNTHSILDNEENTKLTAHGIKLFKNNYLTEVRFNKKYITQNKVIFINLRSEIFKW